MKKLLVVFALLFTFNNINAQLVTYHADMLNIGVDKNHDYRIRNNGKVKEQYLYCKVKADVFFDTNYACISISTDYDTYNIELNDEDITWKLVLSNNDNKCYNIYKNGHKVLGVDIMKLTDMTMAWIDFWDKSYCPFRL